MSYFMAWLKTEA